MVMHYIILSSSYSKGKRIALDYTITDTKDFDKKIENVVKEITEVCGKDVSLSTHLIQTDSKEWRSVVNKDYFFKNVEVIASIEKFILMIQNDRKLSGIDVAKYILSKVECTHLKIEKLVYLCYAEYLINFHKILFEDKIYAYQYGPVVKSVFDKYKKYGYEELSKKDINAKNISEMSIRSRIMFAEDGINKLRCIDKTLDKYGNCTASKLIEITHRENTPWSISGKGIMKNEIISDETIMLYHKNENLDA